MLLALVLLGSFLFSLVLWFRTRAWPWVYPLFWALWCTFFAIEDTFTHQNWSRIFNAVLAIYWWRDFWKNRPRKKLKKLGSLIGAKTKAVLDRMIEVCTPKKGAAPI